MKDWKYSGHVSAIICAMWVVYYPLVSALSALRIQSFKDDSISITKLVWKALLVSRDQQECFIITLVLLFLNHSNVEAE